MAMNGNFMDGRTLRSVAIAGIVGALVFGAYSVFKPTKPESSATILLAPQDSNTRVPIATGVNQATPLSILSGIVRSLALAQEVTKDGSMTPKEFFANLTVREETKSNQIVVAYHAATPAKAEEMLKKALSALETINRRVGFSLAEHQVEYLRDTIAKRESELLEAQRDLAAFQSKAKSGVDPLKPEESYIYKRQLLASQFELGTIMAQINQAKAVAIKSGATSIKVPNSLPGTKVWRDKLLSLEYELNAAQISMGPDAAAVKKLRKELDVARSMLQQEIANAMTSVSTNLDPALAALEARRVTLEWQIVYYRGLSEAAPQEAIKLNSLSRRVQILTATLTTLHADFERARVDAQVDKAKWSVLDPPHPSSSDSIMTHLKWAAIGFVFGAILSFMYFGSRSGSERKS